jgi:hypothetical protein
VESAATTAKAAENTKMTHGPSVQVRPTEPEQGTSNPYP